MFSFFLGGGCDTTYSITENSTHRIRNCVKNDRSKMLGQFSFKSFSKVRYMKTGL